MRGEGGGVESRGVVGTVVKLTLEGLEYGQVKLTLEGAEYI